MSVAVSHWVWQHSKTGGGDRLLLLAIADNADDDGDNAWPSIATLAHKTQTSERTVQRGIQRLERDGCIVVERGAGRGGTHRYRVLMDAQAAGRPVDEPGEDPAQGVSICHPVTLTEGVTQPRHQGGDTQVSPERPERPSNPPNPPASRGAKCSHGRSSCRRCGTSPRAADRRQLLADAEAAAAELHQLERARSELPWCGDRSCDQHSRWRETDRGQARCPLCHPDVAVPRPPAELVDLAARLPELRRTG